ncbi:MAG TPA: MFS transporter [Chloroflexota bacterium]|jgi:sugar phosphate permease|nr:MFS transporter [Chloroflexota bacterium]
MIATLVRGRLHYAWIVMAATFLTMLAAAGVRSVPGVLVLPLEAEFGWTRAAISLAVSINLVLFGLCGPFAAAVMERIGMRRMMVGALATLGLAVALTVGMRAVWQLQLLWGLVVGLGSGAMAGWVAATVANRWFAERRGLVVGILTAANATGQLVFLPILASLIVSAGWRWAVLLVSAAALLAIPPVALLIRDRPQDVGLRPYGAPEGVGSAVPPARPSGNPFATALGTLRRGVRDRDFLLLAGSFFICGASTNGLIGTHLIPASIEHGIPEVTAAGFLAVIGVFDVVGTTASGWLSDRFDSRWLLAWYYGLRGLSLLFLPYAYGTGLFGLALFVVFYGLDWVATVPPTVRLTADIFGRHSVGTVFAWILASHQLGAAAIAFGAGALRTWLGDYQIAFMTSGVLCLIAAGMVVRIGKAAGESRSIVPQDLAAA